MVYSKRYNDSMKRVGDSLTAVAAAGYLLFLFAFLNTPKTLEVYVIKQKGLSNRTCQ